MIMIRIASLALLSLLTVSASAAEPAPPKKEQVTGLTTSNLGLGIPNGSSSDEEYLKWLVPTTDAGYGYTKEKPVEIGGFLQGMGNRWPAQYFSSLLGPNGEPTHFERVKSCCGFPLSEPKLIDAGFKVGFLDVYRVTIQGKEPVLVYVSLYSESRIFAPAGFTTRGNGL
jgi:hypothetical protein